MRRESTANGDLKSVRAGKSIASGLCAVRRMVICVYRQSRYGVWYGCGPRASAIAGSVFTLAPMAFGRVVAAGVAMSESMVGARYLGVEV